MNSTITIVIAVVAAVIIIAVVIAWILTSSKAKAAFKDELGRKETEIRALAEQVAACEKDLIRKEAEVSTAAALRESERKQHEQALAEIKASQEKAIEAARTALALENEKMLKAREEALKKEAAETMKNITGGLDRTIKGMTEAFEAHKKSHAEESSSINTQFAETVKHLK